MSLPPEAPLRSPPSDLHQGVARLHADATAPVGGGHSALRLSSQDPWWILSLFILVTVGMVARGEGVRNAAGWSLA